MQQGTDRNRAALDWIETQLKNSGWSKSSASDNIYDAPAPPPPRSAGLVLLGQTFSTRPECCADNAGCGRRTRGGKPQKVRSLQSESPTRRTGASSTGSCRAAAFSAFKVERPSHDQAALTPSLEGFVPI